MEGRMENRMGRFSPLQNGLAGLEEQFEASRRKLSSASHSDYDASSPSVPVEEALDLGRGETEGAKSPRRHSPLKQGLQRRRPSAAAAAEDDEDDEDEDASSTSRSSSSTRVTMMAETTHEGEADGATTAATATRSQEEEKEAEELLLVSCLEAQESVLRQREHLARVLERARHGLLWWFSSTSSHGGSVSGGRRPLCHRAIRNLGLDPLEEQEERNQARMQQPATWRVSVSTQQQQEEEEEEEDQRVKMEMNNSNSGLHGGNGRATTGNDLRILRCFAALPPPALREAQSRFKDVVEAAVELASTQLEARRLKDKFCKIANQ